MTDNGWKRRTQKVDQTGKGIRPGEGTERETASTREIFDELAVQQDKLNSIRARIDRLGKPLDDDTPTPQYYVHVDKSRGTVRGDE